MATPAYDSVGSTSRAAALTTDLTPTYPATIDAGDFALMAICHRQNTAGITYTITDGGRTWTEIAVVNAGGGAPQCYVYGRVCDGDEDGDTVTLDCSATDAMAHRSTIWRVTGVRSSDFFEAVGSALTTGTTVNDIGVTAGGAERLAVNVVFHNGTPGSFGSFTGETGGDWEERTWSDGGTNPSIGLQTAAPADGGTVDGGTKTITAANVRVIGFALIGASLGQPAAKRMGGVPFAAMRKGQW